MVPYLAVGPARLPWHNHQLGSLMHLLPGSFLSSSTVSNSYSGQDGWHWESHPLPLAQGSATPLWLSHLHMSQC